MEHAPESFFLDFGIGFAFKIIEAYLPYCRRFFLPHKSFKFAKTFVGDLVRMMRMKPGGERHEAVLRGQLIRSLVRRGIGADVHEIFHAKLARALDHGFAIGIKSVKMKMTVRIN